MAADSAGGMDFGAGIPMDAGVRLGPLPVGVVSIQSQVVYGSVGNNIAVPALVGAGHVVAAVPTVLLGNTPHYPDCVGEPVPGARIGEFLDALLRRGVLPQLRAVITGYLGRAEAADAVGGWLQKVLAERPDLLVATDPVLGDHDSGLYVEAALAGRVGPAVVRQASWITPNHFELEQLAGAPLPDLEASIAGARTLLGGRLQAVLVTSAPDPQDDVIAIAVVERDRADVVRHRRIAFTPKGTGDLFAAHVLAGRLASQDLVTAVRKAGEATAAAIERALAAHSEELLPLP